MNAWIERNIKGDPIIWSVIFVLSIISIAVVYSAIGSLAYKNMGGNTEHYLLKHSLLVFAGLTCMWFAHKVNYKYYSGLSRLALWLSIPLLVFTYFMGSTINDANRVIPILGLTFQTSDFAKLALISHLASMLAKRQANIEDFKESFIPVVFWCGGICGLIALANLSTAVILFSTCMLIMFIGRVPMKYLAVLVVVGVFCLGIGLALGQRLGTFMSRVVAFWESMTDPAKIPDQAQQAFIAIASGGFFGTGPGQSAQSDFIPHAYSDFIYAVIIEEYGLIGAVVVLFLYLVLLYRGLIIVTRSDRAFGGLLSAGLAFSLVIQAMINMGVAVGLGPVTGQPLPLLSMGGTSLLFTGISLGIILSVSRGDISEAGSITNNENKNVPRKQPVPSDN